VGGSASICFAGAIGIRKLRQGQSGVYPKGGRGPLRRECPNRTNQHASGCRRKPVRTAVSRTILQRYEAVQLSSDWATGTAKITTLESRDCN